MYIYVYLYVYAYVHTYMRQMWHRHERTRRHAQGARIGTKQMIQKVPCVPK